MKTIFSKKWLIISVSVMLSGMGIIWACADDSWFWDYGNSNFTPEVFVQPNYTPFFFSYQQYYDIGYDDNQNYRFDEANIKDWQGYLGKEADTQTIKYLLYQATNPTVDSLKNYLAGSAQALPNSLMNFTYLHNIHNPKLLQFINYLVLAKEAEGYATNQAEDWPDEDTTYNQPKDYSSLLTKMVAAFNTTDNFIQQRYWFQIVRYYFFNKAPQKAIDFFDQHQNDFDKNTMYYRTMSYAAGAYYKMNNYSEANYLYSIVYDKCDALKTTAHFSFHPQEESDWQATLALAKTYEEKITLWQMLGIIYKDEKRSIKEIYALDPASDKLDLLLVRAINKLEQDQNALSATDFYYEDTLTDKNNSLLTLITQDIDPNKTHSPFLWTLAAGYLNMLHGHFAAAQTYLNKAKPLAGNDTLQQWQLRLLEAINYTASTKVIDATYEKNMLKDLQWLRDDSTQWQSLRHENAFAFIKENIAQKYKKQGELTKSELFKNNINFFADDKEVDKLIAFMKRDNKSDYEKLAQSLSAFSLEDLYEYKAIRAAFDNRIEDAISYLELAPKAASTKLLANPFNGFIADCHDCEFQSFKGRPYTKLSFLEKIREMENNIKSGTNVYDNALLLGNAFYSISHYGNARAFSESAIINNYSTPYDLDSIFKKTLTNMQMAIGYYKKAFDAASNNEQKAKCTYMLAKCERNDWYNHNIYFNPNDKRNYWAYDGMINLADMTYFKRLKQDYSTTQYYKEAIKECGYLKTYVNKY